MNFKLAAIGNIRKKIFLGLDAYNTMSKIFARVESSLQNFILYRTRHQYFQNNNYICIKSNVTAETLHYKSRLNFIKIKP